MGTTDQSTINQPTRHMQWIERHRLEMVVEMTSKDANQRLRELRGKNRMLAVKALKSEFSEWLDGSSEVDIEELTFVDHHDTW